MVLMKALSAKKQYMAHKLIQHIFNVSSPVSVLKQNSGAIQDCVQDCVNVKQI
jgi:hypothetical protein